MSDAVTVVDAAEEHLDAIAAIYGAWVRTSAASFELEPPSVAAWRELRAAADPAAGHLLLAALDGGEVLGWAKSGMFRPRAAYSSTVELAVYIAEHARGRGVGNALYAELLGRLDRSGLRLAVAGMSEPNPASRALHVAHGFELVGTFQGVGTKFGRAWDVTWFQRRLRGAELLDELRGLVEAGEPREAVAARAAGAISAARGYRSARVLAPDDDGERVTIAVEADDIDAVERGMLERCARALAPLWPSR
jgi:L-amino acid N-acyltransferase YncA